tara:strand:- start:68 stop:181 length:114 start_codon:yes stop_codon:yes gene_type:complete
MVKNDLLQQLPLQVLLMLLLQSQESSFLLVRLAVHLE